jgi:hypothetical protein
LTKANFCELRVGKKASQQVSQSVPAHGRGTNETCDNVSALAKELGVDRSVLYYWRSWCNGKAVMDLRSNPVCALITVSHIYLLANLLKTRQMMILANHCLFHA